MLKSNKSDKPTKHAGDIIYIYIDTSICLLLLQIRGRLVAFFKNLKFLLITDI